MDNEVQEKLATLELYLKSLPENKLPSPLDSEPPEETAYPGLLYFSPDPDWINDVGKEGAVNRELEAALGVRNDLNIFPIKERGRAIQALVPILRQYLLEFPNSVLLRKWLDAALASAEAWFKKASVPIPVSQ